MAKTRRPAVRRLVAVVLIVAAAWLASQQRVRAQPVTREVLDDAEVSHRDDGSTTLVVSFRFPVNYLSHFPLTVGETVAISIRLTSFEKEPAQSVPRRREALRPPRDAGIPLTDIVYDEEALWSPYLILHFSEPVEFRVSEGRDARSIVVEFPGPEARRQREPRPSASARGD